MKAFDYSLDYANHKGGKKYNGAVPDDKKGQSGSHGRAELPQQSQELEATKIKAESARIFKEKWDACRANTDYQAQRKRQQDHYET